jgi:hypothetical protein
MSQIDTSKGWVIELYNRPALPLLLKAGWTNVLLSFSFVFDVKPNY